jgi:hypothetical protein
LFDLGLGGAVKAGTESGKEAKDLRIRVALDRYIDVSSVKTKKCLREDLP